jgi:hypothetical protein
VYEEITGKIRLVFIGLGEHRLKNIAQPVRAYRIAGEQLAIPRVSVTSALALPDKPSIAAIPFTSMSGDPRELMGYLGLIPQRDRSGKRSTAAASPKLATVAAGASWSKQPGPIGFLRV